MESWKGKTAEKCSRGFMMGQNSHMKVVKEKTGWKWMQVKYCSGDHRLHCRNRRRTGVKNCCLCSRMRNYM